jgi:hypothetical protein
MDAPTTIHGINEKPRKAMDGVNFTSVAPDWKSNCKLTVKSNSKAKLCKVILIVKVYKLQFTVRFTVDIYSYSLQFSLTLQFTLMF